MFDQKQVQEHVEFIEEQSQRKTMIGKAGYSERKLWEEMKELRAEIVWSKNNGQLTDNFINELGDLIFCVMGNPALAEELQERLKFDKARAKQFRVIDLRKIHAKKEKADEKESA